ncbi:hypothetical protein ACIPY0_00125 [Paenarthrobacter nicotinovorans]|uniref:hypothetical protein n=1 Tax=Paenarthrobacter nicotinovorans TaxID=29320 RepID=UPI0038194668
MVNETAEHKQLRLLNALSRHLRSLPGIIRDLDVTLTMQAVTGSSGAGGVAPKERNAFHLGASEVMGRYKTLLAHLCNVIDRDLQRFEYIADPHRMAEKVRIHRRWLLEQLITEEWVYEFNDLAREYQRVVDISPTGMVFAGICPLESEDGEGECGTAVFARPGSPNARCPKCKGTWDVTDWRQRAILAAGYEQGTAAAVSRMLSDPVTGDALPQSTIRSWVRRGKLRPIGHDSAGNPVYQVRKVRALWARMKASVYNQKKAG